MSDTNTANQNTANKVFALTAGQTITLGTCGLTGAAFTGDTYLRFYGPSGSQVYWNDGEGAFPRDGVAVRLPPDWGSRRVS